MRYFCGKYPTIANPSIRNTGLTQLA